MRPSISHAAGQAVLHRFDKLAAVLVDEPARQAVNGMQLLDRLGLRPGELQQCPVTDQPVRRMVERARQFIAQDVHLSQDGRLPAVEAVGAAEIPEAIGIEFLGFQLEAGDVSEIFVCFFEAVGGAQLGVQDIAQGQQVARVHLGVAAVAGWQRAARPVVGLMLLAVADAEQVLQHVTQADALVATDTRGRQGIEDIRHIEIEIALEAYEIIFGGVEDDLDGGVGEDGREGAEVGEGERIDEQIFGRRRELDQAGAAAIGVQAVRLGVAGNARLRAQALDRGFEGAAVVNVGGGGEHDELEPMPAAEVKQHEQGNDDHDAGCQDESARVVSEGQTDIHAVDAGDECQGQHDDGDDGEDAHDLVDAVAGEGIGGIGEAVDDLEILIDNIAQLEEVVDDIAEVLFHVLVQDRVLAGFELLHYRYLPADDAAQGDDIAAQQSDLLDDALGV